METTAEAFAHQLLLPPAWVLETPELRKLPHVSELRQDVLWRLVLDLADGWGVTGSFAATALDSYRVIRLNQRTREIRQAA